MKNREGNKSRNHLDKLESGDMYTGIQDPSIDSSEDGDFLKKTIDVTLHKHRPHVIGKEK